METYIFLQVLFITKLSSSFRLKKHKNLENNGCLFCQQVALLGSLWIIGNFHAHELILDSSFL